MVSNLKDFIFIENYINPVDLRLPDIQRVLWMVKKVNFCVETVFSDLFDLKIYTKFRDLSV